MVEQSAQPTVEEPSPPPDTLIMLKASSFPRHVAWWIEIKMTHIGSYIWMLSHQGVTLIKMFIHTLNIHSHTYSQTSA